MLNIFEVAETNKMIEKENLDVRTITLGISLLDCIDSDLERCNRNVYEKITRVAGNLVSVGEEIEKEFGIPIVNKRISVTPMALVGAAACKAPADFVTLAHTMDRAAKAVGVNLIGGYSALVSKGMTPADEMLIHSIPQALVETERVCSSVNLGSTKTGINMDGVRLMEQHGVEYNVLCTLTREAAKYPQKIWKAITKQDFKWVQFTPCLGELSVEEDNSYALTPQDFASFYIQLFSCWLDDFHKGAYRSIKLIDDLVNYLAYQIPTSCGINGKCQPQLIVEADGSVFPCDFYCLDEYLLGNFREQSLEELFLLSVKSEMRSRERRLICEKCPYEKICGGGCKRMQKEVYCGAGDGSCGMRSFLDYSLDKLQEIARQAVR